MLYLADINASQLSQLLEKYQLALSVVPDHAKISGTFWGEPEAGLIANTLYARSDTPIQSILHESCHYICMDNTRRQQLHTNAGGSAIEESAVCYLQILLADYIPDMGQAAMLRDMDAWGYSFRLGSAKRWFYEDAEDAQAWLIQHQLINQQSHVLFRLRQ